MCINFRVVRYTGHCGYSLTLLSLSLSYPNFNSNISTSLEHVTLAVGQVAEAQTNEHNLSPWSQLFVPGWLMSGWWDQRSGSRRKNALPLLRTLLEMILSPSIDVHGLAHCPGSGHNHQSRRQVEPGLRKETEKREKETESLKTWLNSWLKLNLKPTYMSTSSYMSQ